MGCRVKRAPKNKAGQTRLAFRLIFKGPTGEEVRSWEGTELEATTANERIMNAKAVLIDAEIESGSFDYLKHFPQGNKAGLFTQYRQSAEPQTIRQYFEKWKKDKIVPFVKKSYVQTYTSHFSQYILPLHGEKYMQLYSVTDLRELRADIVEKKKLKMKTARNVVDGTLRAFFRDAKAEGVIEKNPFDELPDKWWPKNIVPPPSPFTEEERDELLGYFKKKYFSYWPHGYAFLLTLFWTGARPSELTARTWRDYDPRTAKLDILTSRVDGEIGATKTTASKRTIQLLKPVRDVLERIRPLRAGPDDYIFVNQKGKPIDQGEFSDRHFQPALTVLKIRHRDFYSTRDTFISVMLSYGEQAKKIAENCGTSVYMIEESYGKWIGDSTNFGAAALAGKRREEQQQDLFQSNSDRESGRTVVNAVDYLKGTISGRRGAVSEKTGEKISGAPSDHERFPIVKMVRGRGFEP
jgi:integrase